METKSRTTFKILHLASIFSIILFCFGCSTLSQKDTTSSLIIVSAILEKNEPLVNELIRPVFEVVTIRRGDREISFSERSDHYYYFQNVPAGQYEIGELKHLLQKGMGGNSFSNVSVSKAISPPLTREDRNMTIVDVEPGSIVFMGEIEVNANIRAFAPTDIQAKLRKTITAETRAIDYLIRNYPRSEWANLAKDRSKTLKVIQVGE
ncbi:hypothetical protein [Leptospira sp. GIMC2001]|uniref:hypothetical protein n=1 Tax=Leptospira sp. GIMC2001 TaxID=1513297 RepID=UPI00234A16C6|nr:hypothetical protein [Leptospira sp. GIMC2001]WCL49775.1 hypothetical protein O4O04_02855 [Leptospira sp. GIMC2001]